MNLEKLKNQEKVSSPDVSEGETYEFSEIKNFLEKLENDPEKLKKFAAMAEARAKDIFESGHLEEEFKEGDKVLYIGAGTGHVPKYIEDKTGVEIVKVDLKDIRTSDTKDAKFIEANARRLPFPDNSQDTICLFDMLHHTKNQQEILQEARRVLKPGGKLLILEDTIPESFKKGVTTMKGLVGKMDDAFNKQPKGVNPHNYHSVSDWELMLHNEGLDVDANDTKSWYWGPADFLPEAVRPKRPEERTVARPFESTLLKVIKGEEREKEPDFTELEERWFKK